MSSRIVSGRRSAGAAPGSYAHVAAGMLPDDTNKAGDSLQWNI